MQFRLLIILTFILSMINLSVHCAEYSVRPKFNNSLIVDDNLRLIEEGHKTVVGDTAAIKFDMDYKTASSELSFIPEFQFARYSDDVGLDAENMLFNIDGQKDINGRLRVSLRSSVREQVVSVADANVSGLTFNEIQKESMSILPSVDYSISNAQLINMSYFFSEVDYPEASEFSFVGNETDELSLFYTYQSSEKNKLTATLASRFTNIPDINTERQVTLFEFGLERQQSGTLSLGVSFGFNYSESEFKVLPSNGVEQKDKQNVLGNLYSFALNKEFSFMNLAIWVEKTVNPNIRGGQDVTERYSLDVSKRMTAQLTTTLSTYFKENESQQITDVANNDFNIFQFQINNQYQYSKKISFDIGYIYGVSKNANSTSKPESNRIYCNVAYQFERISWLR